MLAEVGHVDHLVRLLGDLAVALARDRDHLPVARAHLLEVRDHLVVDRALRFAITTTGMFSSISAIGPCFISPAA